VLNAGSSSLKWVLLESESERALDSGNIGWSGARGSGNLEELQDVLRGIGDVAAVGHRIVHGGSRFRESVLIDDPVRDAILDLKDLAPLHNPSAVAGIDAARSTWPAVPQVAAFDTAFHSNLSDAAATYALPWEWTERWQIRRYGFHGLSVQYALRRATEMLGAQPARLIVCHLGAGCSITAVDHGRSADTSMGFTPMEGLMMVQRSGSVDPGVVLYLLQRMRADELDHALNERSGVAGVSGVSTDLREVIAAADAGNTRAALALKMFCRRVSITIGGMAAVLGGLDALVFTGGIGENSPAVRGMVLRRLGFLGLAEDPEANAQHGRLTGGRITRTGGPALALVVPTDEELMIARDTARLITA
jgi:acetate kinase